jgi:hypothetical protein
MNVMVLFTNMVISTIMDSYTSFNFIVAITIIVVIIVIKLVMAKVNLHLD